MSAHAATIEQLAGRLRDFLRDREIALMHVVAATELRAAIVRTVMAAEHALVNRSPFVLLEHPHRGEAPGWSLRSAAARDQHQARRAGAEPPIPDLPPPPPGDDARAGFAGQVWQLLGALPPGAEGLVIVLAPTFVETPKIWAEAVGLLVGGRLLKAARWIVIDTEASTVNPVVAALGDRAIQHDARMQDSDGQAALADLAAGVHGAAPSGAKPPKRPDMPERMATPEAERRAAVRKGVLEAALAQARGDGAAAVTSQRKARDLCAEAGWTDDAVAMELVLGGQLFAAGQARPAEESFARAIDTARTADLHGKVATAGFALGAARMARRERHTALVAYAEASLAAERSGDPMLAIEGSRLAGHAAADLKMEPQAITFYTRAVKLADGVAQVGLTSAAEAARALAKICRRRGLRDRAVELEAQAERFAKPPEVPVAPMMPEGPATSDLPATSEPPARPEAAARADTSAGTAPSIVDVEPAGDTAQQSSAPKRSVLPDHVARIVNLPRPDVQPTPDPAELLGALAVPPDQVRFLPEGSALIDRKAFLAGARPPADGTILLDGEAGAAPPPSLLPAAEGTILLDDLRPPVGLPASPPALALDEGTGLLTLEEIADLHWGGVAPVATPPAQGNRSWTKGEIAILQRVVDDALEPEATLMLSRDELAAMRGEKVERPVESASPELAAAIVGELHVDGLEPEPPRPIFVHPAATPGLEPIPGLERPPELVAPPPAARVAETPEHTIDGDEVTMLTRADIMKIREAIRARREREQTPEPDEDAE